ncbi:Cullin-4B [Magnaporthiopsis poae ATCC 64411]|uniref:Cullin-4B n=1 Tax=Magnaporthiopsis poae (strain ATCC 64411 / 73-15) TaxID=644358 RepID=A0A0C4E5W9_MAGP6|nr:Cullin-4B [Magnaporthiopsis poae ATCC 64411]
MLRQRCEAYLAEVVLPRIRAEGASSSLQMLATVYRCWKEWSAQSTTIRSTFSYLDRTFLLKNNKEYMVLNDLFITLFRRMVFVSRNKDPDGPSPGAMVLDGMCRLVQLDRTGDKGFDPQLLQVWVNIMHVFNMYGKSFEPRLLRESEKYFEEFSEERSEGCSLKDYIRAARGLIQREDERCNIYNFDSTTKKQIIDTIHRIVVREHTAKLLSDDDVGRLVDECDVESLHALYELLQMTGLHGRLQGPWDRYISTQGSGIINDVDHTDDMVVRLLVLRRKLDVVVRDSFLGDEDFTYAMREAFRRVINAKPALAAAATSRVGEMVAKYIDMLLRGGLKALPQALISDHKDRAVAERTGVSTSGDEDGELSRQLDKALELFRLIEGKDVFEAFYKRDLARRLLLGRSASQDAERDMLAKLHDECGSTFTHNLEQMFKDQALGKEELSAYKQWRDGSETTLPKVDLDVSVLSSAAWPSYPDEPAVALPPGVALNLSHFERYYKGKHTGRRLTWKHSLSHCVIRATFPKGAKELVMSAHQAAVLVLFNNVGLDEPLAYEEIEGVSLLKGDLLNRTLQSLACGKVRVLTKTPRGREVARTDTFTINKQFADPKFRVKINQIQLKETKQENKETHERVAADRQFETQAAIVRIMKSRKTMPHAQLVAEVIEQTRRRGAMDPADIKVNIEKLIEKDYIEREGNSYTYLA